MAKRALEILAAMLLLVPATSATLSQNLSSVATGAAATGPSSPSPLPLGNVTAVTGSRLVITGIAAHRPGLYSDLPSSAESFQLFGHRSFAWVFLSRVGDRAGADLTVANYGTQGTVAVITCDAPTGMAFAALETPGYGAGSVTYFGDNSYGMLLPGGASGNFTLIYMAYTVGQHTSTCTLSEGS